MSPSPTSDNKVGIVINITLGVCLDFFETKWNQIESIYCTQKYQVFMPHKMSTCIY